VDCLVLLDAVLVVDLPVDLLEDLKVVVLARESEVLLLDFVDGLEDVARSLAVRIAGVFAAHLHTLDKEAAFAL